MSHNELALVHNGIIENHEQQRERLRALGYEFTSQTDTEVVAHLIHHYRAQGDSLMGALQKAVKGMLPKGPLGYAMIKKLKVYAGASHPHTAQQPRALQV